MSVVCAWDCALGLLELEVDSEVEVDVHRTSRAWVPQVTDSAPDAHTVRHLERAFPEAYLLRLR